MLYLLTGAIASGKTVWLGQLIERAKAAQIPLDGLITPAVFEDGKKVAIDCLLFPQEERIRFANWEHFDAPQGEVYETSIKMPWVFRDEAVQRVNEHFACITPSNPARGILLVDELGWMEFNEGSGFTEAMRVLDAGLYRDAIVVIRPALLESAKNRWAHLVGVDNVQVIEPGFCFPL